MHSPGKNSSNFESVGQDVKVCRMVVAILSRHWNRQKQIAMPAATYVTFDAVDAYFVSEDPQFAHE